MSWLLVACTNLAFTRFTMFRHGLEKIEWFYDISISVIDYDYFVDDKGLTVVCWLQLRDDFKVVRCFRKEENGPFDLYQQRKSNSRVLEE